ncbi:hypothetical protein EON77_17925, partial [bacterium]
ASGRDYDRALTPSGRDRVRQVAKLLVAENELPSLVLTSPLVRAEQTADIVATLTDLRGRQGALTIRRELEPGQDGLRLVAECLRMADAEPSSPHAVMLVGHEPDLSALVGRLSGRAMPAGMDKAMVAGLDATHARGVPAEALRGRLPLAFLLAPKVPTLERFPLPSPIQT